MKTIKMKDSGIEWIGQIPDDWKVERFQWYLEEIKVVNAPVQTKQVLSLTNKSGVIPYEEKGAQGNVSKEDFSQYKLAYPNTIVANSMNILIGSVGICKYFGCISPVYYVFKPNSFLNLHFANYIMQTAQFQKELRKYANGIMEIRLRLSSSDILKREIPVPNVDVQEKIVDALDVKCAEIDKLIANQQEQIDKLKEYKQSVITEAVTKGLDPTVPMKDSGVEWIGQIPQSWTMSRIKNICTLNPTQNKCDSSIDIVSYLPMECVKNGYIINREIDVKSVPTGLAWFIENDIIMAKVTPCFENGNIAIAQGLTNKIGCGSSELFVFRPKEVVGKFLLYLLQNRIFTEHAKSTMNGTGGLKRVSPSFVKNFSFALPCSETQQQIADYLDDKCGKIDQLIAIKQQKIDKLQQYKKSLIYEYVTGKKEV